jgi:hypothetical protein
MTKHRRTLLRLACALALLGCGSGKSSAPAATPAPKAPPPDLAPRAQGTATATLPEDPIAAKRSSAQWQQHLDHEEAERQMGFDRRHLPEHKAVLKLLQNARSHYEAASSESALHKVSADMPRELAQIERKLKELDPWGNNSRVLSDYAALQAMLGKPYADAKRAAISGDEHALDRLREGFDARLEKIGDWLEKSEENEEEE